MKTGSRSDIVFRDGLRRGSLLRSPDCQSTYSAESAVAQNFLSSFSFLNSGSFFFISLVGPHFVPVHVPGRNHSDEPPPDGEHYKQPPADVSLPERVISLFSSRMANVTSYHKRLTKKDALGFLRRHMVPFPVLVGIRVVPFKPGAILQRIHCRHNFSIRLSYTCLPSATSPELTSGAPWPGRRRRRCRTYRAPAVRPAAHRGLTSRASAPRRRPARGPADPRRHWRRGRR